MDTPLSEEQGSYAPWRLRYTGLGAFLCLALMGWGGWVTSIEAGLAVPDWPTSFGSLDPIATGFSDPANPDSKWWMHPPILAEHGHRLLGMLVGLWACGLVLWTWLQDRRRAVRLFTLGILALVIVQGVLGGLRVVWVSLDMAVVHALGAQLFFSSIVAFGVLLSASWLRPSEHFAPSLQQLAVATAVATLVQIFLGVLLRHPGGGVHLGFTIAHGLGSIIVLVLVLKLFARLRSHAQLGPWAWGIAGGVGLQIMLGMMALAVLLYEHSVGALSFWQVFLNSAHLIVGTLILGSAVGISLQVLRPTFARS